MTKFSLRSIGPVLLAYGVLIGGGYFLAKAFILPAILGNSAQTIAGSSASQDYSSLTLLGDTFSGYSTFRNDAFKGALQEAGGTIP